MNSIDEIKTIAQRGLDVARKQGASATKLLFEKIETTACSFENGRLKTASSRRAFSYRVTTLAANKLGTVDIQTRIIKET